MKNITDFIVESMINESVKLYKMTAGNASAVMKVQDATRNFLKFTKTRYSFTNQLDVQKFFNDVCKYSNIDRHTLKTAGIPDGKTLVAPIIAKKEELEKEGWKFDAVKSFDETEMQKQYKAWKKSDDYSAGKHFDRSKYQNADEQELERTLVIYYCDDPGNPDTTIEYPYKGTRKSNDHQAHMDTFDWHIATGLKYYDGRQILLSNYLKKSEAELAKREVVIDNSDL